MKYTISIKSPDRHFVMLKNDECSVIPVFFEIFGYCHDVQFDHFRVSDIMKMYFSQYEDEEARAEKTA